MHTDELDYELPAELIAQYPTREPGCSRLLVVDRTQQRWRDRQFVELPGLLKSDDVLVINNTRVLPAKFFLRRPTGGRIEALWVDLDDAGNWNVLLRGASRLKTGEVLRFEGATDRYEVIVLSKGQRGAYCLKVSPIAAPQTVLDEVGLMPLPHYIKREDGQDERIDRDRYQTVYAKQSGAIAAPTAGLHFNEFMLDQVRQRGIEIVQLTLHIGLGTFQPIEVASLEDHLMHSEHYQVQPEVWEAIRKAKSSGQRIVAVGTTSTRVLETIARTDQLSGKTNIFIYPPYSFDMTDTLITNFHLPRSTLLAMIYAFGGTELMRRAYAHAITHAYRFYSYGDAMLIE